MQSPANFDALFTGVRNLLAIAQRSRNTFRYNPLQTHLLLEKKWITN